MKDVTPHTDDQHIPTMYIYFIDIYVYKCVWNEYICTHVKFSEQILIVLPGMRSLFDLKIAVLDLNIGVYRFEYRCI